MRNAVGGGVLFARIAVFALLLLGIASCGGGGGGSGSDNSGASFSVSSNAITFTATQGGTTPAAQVVNINVNGGQVFVGTSQSGNTFSHVFQITGNTSGRITITPDAPVNPGTFSGSITVTGCSNNTCTSGQVSGSPKVISVTYVIVAAPVLTTTSAAVDFSATSGISPAATSLTLARSTGSAAWSGSITYTSPTTGWLSVTPLSAGALPSIIGVSANATGVPAGRHTANITFTSGALNKTVPVSFTVTDPIVNFTSPYVATASIGGNVIIRGFGFSGVASGLQVLFGSTPATVATLVSDTEIHASFPALIPGSYSVVVKNPTTTLATRARLLVVNPPNYAYTAVARATNPSHPGELIYDAERQALLFVDRDRSRIEAYRFNGSTWIVDTPVSLPLASGNPSIALSPDGTELLGTVGASMLRINPATLATFATVDANTFLGTGGRNLNLLDFANDGNAIGNAYSTELAVSLYRYDMLTQQFYSLSSQPDLTNRTIVASADGAKLFLPTFESLIPSFAKPVFTYSASTRALSQTATTTSGSGHVSVDRTGDNVIMSAYELSIDQTASVYNGSMTLRGILPDGSHDLRGFVISPDGATAYAYYSGTAKIRKFNLNSPGGGTFAEIGTGTTVPDSPSTSYIRMAISGDGGTLFLVGNQRVIVMPAP